MKLFKLISQKWKTLDHSIYEGSRLTTNLTTIAYLGLIVMLYGIIFGAMYFAQGFKTMILANAAAVISGSLIFFFAKVKKQRTPAQIIAFVMCIILFTAELLVGVLNGFALFWLFILPVAFCFFFSVKYGIILSLYYLLLLTAMFYTPLRSYFAKFYPKFYLNRIPIIYSCYTLVTAISMIQYHDGVLFRIGYERRLESEVRRQTLVANERLSAIEELSDQVITTLANTIDAKDKYTTGHSFRVSEYTRRLAKALGYDDMEIDELRQEALLHDVGKIGISDVLLNKKDNLSEDEKLTIRSHTTIGGDILKQLTKIPGAQVVARYHHERYDGKGYPEGLKGENIPEHARIVTIADAYDAMNSDRVYRAKMDSTHIYDEFRQGRGTQFDPHFLDVFMGLLESGALADVDAVAEAAIEKRHIDEMMHDALADFIGMEKENPIPADMRNPNRLKSEIHSYIAGKYSLEFYALMISLIFNNTDEVSNEEKHRLTNTLCFASRKVLDGAGTCELFSDHKVMAVVQSKADVNLRDIEESIKKEFYALIGSDKYDVVIEDL